MPNRKTPRSGAVYRRVLQAGNRTVRVASYAKREDQETGVTFGIGLANPDKFAKITFEVTPELWLEIDEAVREALKVNGYPIAEPEKPKRTRKAPAKSTRKKKTEANGAEPDTPQASEGSNGSEPDDDAGIVPPPTQGQPARRRVGAIRPEDIKFGQ